jgi:hypothetical protein
MTGKSFFEVYGAFYVTFTITKLQDIAVVPHTAR